MQRALRESRSYANIAMNKKNNKKNNNGAGCSGSGSSSNSGGGSVENEVAVEVAVESRYPKRERPRVNYTELETPDDDHFLCK